LTRRTLIAAGTILWLAPLAAYVEATPRPLKVGRLSEGRARPDLVELFRDTMRELGHTEVVIEIRDADGKLDRLPALATELVQMGVDVICAHGSGATEVAKNATSKIPIVMVSLDAVGAGLVSNLARPGGNVTGLTLIGSDLARKRLELLVQMVPGSKRLTGVAHGVPGIRVADTQVVSDWIRQSEAAARVLRLPFTFAEIPPDPAAWDEPFASLAAVRGTALSVIESPFFLTHRVRLAELASKYRLPAIYAFGEHVKAGGLLSYGVDSQYIIRRVAFYVSRIAQGAKPGALPVEAPTQYDLTINLNAARALGLSVPKTLLLRANVVTE